MQANTWLALFKRLPQSQHDNLSLVMCGDTEIAIQQIIRLERDFMLVRGRMTGTVDTGVIIVVPYDQIIYMNFVKKLPVDEANELFKGFQAPPLVAAATPAAPTPPPIPTSSFLSDLRGGAAPAPPAVEEFRAVEFTARPEQAEHPSEQTVAEAETPQTGKSGSKGQPISKSMMLARLRARLASEPGKSTPPVDRPSATPPKNG
jgi:hypothetical protein